MKNKLQYISTIIFFGSIWGITEATLGYVLHLIPGLSIYLSGSILFAFASYILYKAYSKTNSKTSLVYIGIVATLIKATNFFLPLTSVFKVINPMASILLESLLLIGVITYISKDNLLNRVSGLLVISFSWRLGYYLYRGSSYLSTTSDYIQFFVIYAISSVLFGLGLIYLDKLITNKLTSNKKLNLFNPVVSLASLILAIVLTLVL